MLEGGRGRSFVRRLRQRTPGFVDLPRPSVEPLSTVDEDYFRSVAFFRRVGIVAVLVVMAFGLLGLRLWSLQLLHGAAYLTQSRAQQTRIVDLPAERGAIVDDDLRPLATAGAQPTVVADVPALGPVSAHSWLPAPRGERVLRSLAALTKLSTKTLIGRIRDSLAQSLFAPAILVGHASQALAFYLDERAVHFPGLHVVDLPARAYPQGALGGEFLGLLGEVSPTELKEPRYPYVKSGEVVGQSGVEATYDRNLNGGFARRVSGERAGADRSPLRPSRATKRPEALRLTIDVPIQRAAERAVKDGIALAHQAGYADAAAGAAVVLDPRTGAIKALVSYPGLNQVAAAAIRPTCRRR